MKPNATRLFFIDAMRAWAILMMLQGHFVDGLLDPIFRNPENPVYSTWLYFRGITAPVFFTVSGFIFTYLLVRVPQSGWQNPRVKKGIRRGLQLLVIGYLLRLNLFGLLKGEVYQGFYLVDVLHCIGLSILAIVGIYLLTHKRKHLFPYILILVTFALFMFEPLYKQWSFDFLPNFIANYFTKTNGSVFTIIPWLGYTAFGGFLSLIFKRFNESRYLYASAIGVSILTGLSLIFLSSDAFVQLYEVTGLEIFNLIQMNNYLFIRLGDVLIVFAVFILIRKLLTNSTILRIGQNTLSIYVIHFIILYGSFTGLGLYRFFHHGLNPTFAIFGALSFMLACTFFALWYERNEVVIKNRIAFTRDMAIAHLQHLYKSATPFLKEFLEKAKLALLRIFGIARG